MEFSEPVICAAVVAATLLLSYLLTYAARFIAPRIGLLDQPDGKRKLHARPIPVLGGCALYATLLLVYAVYWLLAPEPSSINDSQTQSRLFHLLCSGGLFCFLGVCDDKWALRPRVKLFGQVIASLPFALGGPPLPSISLCGFTFELGILAPLMTVLWLVACVNVVNLIDGLDGLAGCISLIATTTIGLRFLLYGDVSVAMESLILAGAIAGFLIHNWPPAKIFLGDSGSMTLGFLIGALALQTSLKTATVFTLSVPLVVLSVPIFDTAMAILRRKLTGRGIGDGDRQHIHHHLQDRGLSKVQTLLAITGLCLLMAVTAIVAAYLRSDLVALLMCAAMFTAIVSLRVFGHHETKLVFQHVQAIQGVIADAGAMLRTRFVLARIPNGAGEHRDELWQRLRLQLEAAGGTGCELAFSLGSSGENESFPHVRERLQWHPDVASLYAADTWELRFACERSDQFRCEVRLRGRFDRVQRGRPLDDMVRLVSNFCHAYPLADRTARISEPDFPATIPMPAANPTYSNRERRVA